MARLSLDALAELTELYYLLVDIMNRKDISPLDYAYGVTILQQIDDIFESAEIED